MLNGAGISLVHIVLNIDHRYHSTELMPLATRFYNTALYSAVCLALATTHHTVVLARVVASCVYAN